MFSIRASLPTDHDGVAALYRAVAASEGGLARSADEITDAYVEEFLQRVADGGLGLVAVDQARRIIGEIHAYRLEPRVFGHILSDLTIAVAPDRQGSGVGRALFAEFLRRVELERPEVLRVELIARESNARAIAFYETLGFCIEGRLERRIRGANGRLEADIVMGWLRP